MKPKVSVIVPIYNAELYLNDCIHSILSQSLKDIEVLLMDDESNDNSLNVCKEYEKKDSRIRVFSHKNIGQGLERNIGIEKANGEYIAFIDADDMLKPNMLEIMYELAKKHDADIISVGYEDICLDGSIVRHILENKILSNRININMAMADLIGNKVDDTYKGCIAVWDSLFKKELIDKYQIRFVSERDVYSEDLLFKLNFLRHAKTFISYEEPLYQYRINNESFTNSVNNIIIDRILNLYDLVLEYFENTLGDLGLKERIVNRTFFTLRFNIKKAANSKESKDFYKYIYQNEKLYSILSGYKPSSLKNKLIFRLLKMKKLNLINKFIK